MGGRPHVTWGLSPGGWRPPTNRVCCSRIRERGPIWLPLGSYDPARSVCICGPAPTQKVQGGMPLPQSWAQHPTSQDNGQRPSGSHAKRRCVRAGGHSLSIPQSKETAIPTGMEPLPINVGDTKQIYPCWVEGCLEPPLTSHAAISSHMCWA